MSNEPEIVRTSLRLHRPLYDRLAEAADARGLTMHAEILARLEASFEGRALDGQPLTVEALRDETRKVEQLLLQIDAKLPAMKSSPAPSPKED